MNPHADVKERLETENRIITTAAVTHVQAQVKHAVTTDAIQGATAVVLPLTIAEPARGKP